MTNQAASTLRLSMKLMAKLYLSGVNTIASEGVSAIRCWCRRRRSRTLGAAILTTVLLTATHPVDAQVSVTTYQYNTQRTGVNSNETILTPSNVNSSNFGELFSQTVDGDIYAQPLYVPNVTINGAVHNVVYVATEHDSVYAFDADSNAGANAQPLWQTSLIPSGATTVSDNYCTDITPEYGITGTPVIDPSTNILYAVGETLESGTYVKRLHALNITTGAEMPGSPVVITAAVTVPGQSTVTFDTLWENQRAGLLLYNGVVYIAFGSHCDGGDWLGWILGYSYNGSSLTQVFVFSTEPSSVNGAGGGIWMSGQGLPMDTGSNLFVGTGNGQFDTTITPPINYGDSVIRFDLSQGPTVQDYFAPGIQATLDSGNQDLGSGGVAILPQQSGPYPNLLVTADKYQTIYVLNRNNLGQYNSTSDNVVQELNGVVGSMFSSPIYFNGQVYFWGANDVLKAFTITNGMLSTSATDQGPDLFNFPGAVPTISANGTSNAILWVLRSDGFKTSAAAVLYAYAPSNLSAGSIYNSNENATRDNPGGAIKFAVPTVVNGKVYVEAVDQLSVFGELADTAPAITSGSSTTFRVGTAGSFTVTTTGAPTPSLSESGTLPSGVTFASNGNGTGTLSGTPASGTAGSYALTITASNGVGTAASQSFTLTINPAVPVITSATTASGTVGSAFSYQITASNTPTSYGATGLPAGLTVSNTTGLISGTPTTAATSTVTLSATNSGGTGNATLTLTINPATSSNCTSPTAVGPYTSCGQAFNDVTSSTTSSVTYSPYAGNGVEVFALYCANSNCNAAPTQTVTSIGDNVNSTETCFTQAPHSPYAFANTNVPDYETIYAWYCPSIPAGVTSFTVTTSAAASYLSLAVTEWEAGTIASTGYFESVDNLNTAGDVAGTTATVSTNGPTTHSNDLITAMLVVCGANGSSPIDAVVGTGYTGITVNPSLDLGLVTEAKSVTSGTQTATTTWSTGTAEGNCALGAGGSNSTWYGVIVPLVGASQAPQVPVMTSATTASGTVGSAFSYQITATNSPTSYGATGLPTGLTVSSTTGLISGTPTAAGTSTVTLSASNSGGTGTGTLTLTVNQAPAITSGSSTMFTVGTAGSFTVTTTGTPTPSLSESGALPSGVTFASNGNGTGTLSGTPASGTAGSYALTITASNGVGTAASQSFTLTVSSGGGSGGGSASWGQMDAWLQMNTSTPGTTLTTSILAAGTVGGVLTSNNFGETGDAGTPSGNADIVLATPFVTGSDARGYTPISVSGYNWGVSTTANFDLGIYADSSGSPGSLLCHTGTTSLTPGNWNFITISLSGLGCPTLSANTQYWSAYITSSNSIGQSYVSGACPGTSLSSVKTSSAQGSAVLPSSFGANSSFSSECYSLYVTAIDNTGAITWSLNPSAATGFTVAASQGSLGGSLTVNGTSYPNGTTTQSLALSNGATAPLFAATNSSFKTASGAVIPTVVANGYVTPGPASVGTNAVDFALVSLIARNGDYALMQLNNGNGDGSGECYCVRVETNGGSGGSTIYSSNITLTPGHRYSYSLLFDETGGTAKMAIYDPSNGFAQVGSTVTVAQTTGGSFGELQLGNSETGTSSGSTTYFEDAMLDWTNHTFPNYPSGGTAPAITSGSSTTFTVGTAGSFTVTTTGAPTPSLSESGTLPSGVTFASNGNGTGTLSGTPASGTAGSYALTITASNGVGTAASQSFTLTVGSGGTAPAITSGSSTTFRVGTAGSFTVTTTGTPTPSLSESGTLPSGVTFASNGNGTGTLSGTPASGTAGSYALTITASNGVGTAASQSFTLTVNQAPAITSGSSTTFTVGTAGSFTVTTTGAPTPSLSESGTLPSGVTFASNGNGTGTLSGTPASGTAGSYALTITASNGVGTAASQSFTLTVGSGGTAPAITSGSSTTFRVGTAGSFTVTTTGTPTPSLSESGTLPSGVTFASNGNGTGTLSGTPASGTAGSYALTITASNGVGTAASQSFTLTVNQAPAITSGSSTTFTVGTAGSFTVTTTGTPTPSLSESGTLPSGVTFASNGNGTGTLSGTPASGTAGSYALTITASNGVGTAASQSFTLTVNQAPAITSGSSTTFTVGTAGSFTVTTTGTPTPSLSESGTLPSGVTFASNGNGTGTLSGTPASGTAGSYALTITASNGVGTAASQSFTLTVSSGGGSGGGSAVYDTSSTATIGNNSHNAVSTTVGTGLSKQGLFLFPAMDDTGPYYVQPGGIITTNSSGLVPLVWRQVGSNETGNGNYHGQCWMGTGGGTFSGTTTTSFQLTGTTGNPSQVIQYSFGYVNQGAVSSAGSATCTSATSGAQSVTLASTSDIATFTDFDTNNNRTMSGCTTTTDLSGFTSTGYSGAHCSGSTSESATWSGYSGTSIALAQAVPHDNGSSAPTCAWEGYNSFTGGTNGTNAVANLRTIQSSQHGNDPGSWTGAGTLDWDTAHYTSLHNATSTLCGDLSTYSGTTTSGLAETGTGTAVSNYLNFTMVGTASIPNASKSLKLCSDTRTSNNFAVDVARIAIGGDFVDVNLQCNGASCFFNVETNTTGNTEFATYTTGNSCASGGSGWVTLALQLNEAGNTACSGKPCSYVKAYSSSGSLLGTGTGTSAGTWSGQGLTFTLGHNGALTVPSGTHIYYSQDVNNYQGTFPPDM